MTEEIKNHIQDLKDEGVRVKVDDEQIKDLVSRIIEDKSAEDKSAEAFFKKCDDKALISRYKGKNANLSPIDGRKVHKAFNKLVNKQITQDEYFEIYNVFSNDVDNMVKKRGSNLGSMQAAVEIYRDELKEIIDSHPDIMGVLLLETEEEATKNRQQSAKGLKILTPQQMLTRLPISLAQLQAGNNSQKLKNEIRQLLYSLYR